MIARMKADMDFITNLASDTQANLESKLAVERADRQAEVGRLRNELNSLRQQRDSEVSALGGALYLTYLLAYVLACLVSCLLACLVSDLLAYVLAYLPTCLLALLACLLAYLLTRLLAYSLAYMRAYLLTYLRTAYLLAYLRTCVLAYLRTCVLAYLVVLACLLTDSGRCPRGSASRARAREGGLGDEPAHAAAQEEDRMGRAGAPPPRQGPPPRVGPKGGDGRRHPARPAAPLLGACQGVRTNVRKYVSK